MSFFSTTNDFLFGQPSNQSLGALHYSDASGALETLFSYIQLLLFTQPSYSLAPTLAN
jgi:hypothetical protein